MVIDGKKLAQELLEDLKKKVGAQKVKPSLAVIQVGDDPGSTSYISQKKKKGAELGIDVIHKHFPESTTQEQLIAEIRQLNAALEINGIIIQRPLPPHIDINLITQQVAREKDVDGFRTDSPFAPPVALGVLYILKSINLDIEKLKGKKIVIVGRGETAGRPIAEVFEKLNIPVTILHSRSSIEDPLGTQQTLSMAEIIISCVGKTRIIKREDISPGVILIGVGISRSFKGLEGDYDEEEVADKAAYYTPTPGGVGPLTVAFLLSNLVGTK